MAKKYVSKIVKFMLSNPADLKRLAALSGVSFSKYVKGKLDEDLLRKENEVEVCFLQEQVRRLQKENTEIKRQGVSPVSSRPKGDNGNSANVNDWFED